MPPLDWSRFVYSLAGELLAGAWTPASMQAAQRAVALDRRPPTLGNIARLLRAFPQRPTYAQLTAYLHGPAGWRFMPGRLAKKGARLPVRGAALDARPVRLRHLSLPALPTVGALAAWLGIRLGHLHWLADIAGRNRQHPAGPLRTYRHRWIPRREGLPRLLEIPKARFKEIQRYILAELLNRVPVHAGAHGFCPGRSIVTHAAMHCGRAVVLRFDLTDFFPSVSAARVRGLFRALGYPAPVARLLTGLCTTRLPADVWDRRPGAREGADFIARQRLISRHLPQGAPTSPALANLAAHRLDRRLAGLAQAADVTYTRYADDLTFSGGDPLAAGRLHFQARVAAIACEEGFWLNHRKTRLMRAGTRQQVTGVVVNVRPNIPRAQFDELKAILTNCRRHGPASQNRENLPDFRAYLAGRIAHVGAIHPARGKKLGRMFEQIAWT